MYSAELKNHILTRVLPPNSESIEYVAEQEGIAEQTIRNWKAQALSGNGMPVTAEDLPEPEKWSSQDKFLVVLETSGMTETDLGEYARKKGLYVEQIANWRDICINANGGQAKEIGRLNQQLKEKERENKSLRSELNRKEKALAETAALLVLSKKSLAIWGETKAD